ncbi:MAG: hypothetical protein J0L87_15170 [Bacteroidetes bacterium]|nr:hypothetical protein [Bacteroidota bacterium]
MIAYNQTFINNLAVLKKAKQWYAHGFISSGQMSAILKKYHVDFYDPNIFVKIGLFIFTTITVSAALGFYTLFAFTASNGLEFSDLFPIITSIFFAIICIAALELFIRNKMIYRSGVDEALLYSAYGFILSAILFTVDNDSSNGALISSILFLPFLAAGSIRYLDTISSILTVLCVYVIYFLTLLNLGDIAKLIMPFALMLLSAFIYLMAKKQKKKDAVLPWKNCLIAAESIALIIFYLSCNYFVIRESSIEFFDMNLAEGEDIPLAFIFYALTALVPIGYIFMGLKNKDKVSLWIGLLLVAVAVLTFKYYFSLGHPEVTFTIAGMIMILIAYFSIRYLKTDKHGITFKEDVDEDNFLKTNAEALVIAQSFSQQVHSPQQANNDLGGGDFGGGGSGGKF